MQTHRRPLVTHVDAHGTAVLLKGRDGFGFLCLVVVVAVMEEFFWRSFLLRCVIHERFE
jgi:hypothetical protein